jgi:mannose/cellobiose epimerase-like protein (N-acyl-D-glucosamine 2-epimerase family)
VALAASSALTAGHERAALLLEDVLEVIDEHFWSDAEGATRESFSPTWDHPEAYRGANSNMHMCEALLAASVAARRPELAGRAVRITERLIDGEARPRDWMLPEHYGPDWSARLDYNRDRPDDPFRPYGVTMGHLFEWARLLCLAWLATGRSDAWLVESARQLFDRATSVGWDEVHGGIIYTSDFDGTPVNDDHYWWPVAEAIATSAVLASITGDRSYARWYRVFWDFAGTYLIDHRRGGWYAQLDATNERKSGPWYGKPDLYHVLQACIIPATPLSPSVAGSLAGGARVGPEPA